MFQIIVKEYADVLRKVHSLASDRVVANQSASNGNVDLKAVRKKDLKLLEYLNTLDLKTLQVVEAIMYIGRDYSPFDDPEVREIVENANDEEDFERIGKIDYTVPAENPDKLVNDTLAQLNKNADFVDKDISINQIYEKTQLSDYLDRAFIIIEL